MDVSDSGCEREVPWGIGGADQRTRLGNDGFLFKNFFPGDLRNHWKITGIFLRPR